MQIHFRQTGGFGGVAQVAQVDTDQLPPQEAGELISLVAAANVFTRQPDAPTPQPDRETYTLRVEDGECDRTLHFSAAALPPECQPLVQALRRRATYERRSR